MKISVTFRSISESETIGKDYIEEKLLKFKKYFDKPVEVQVVISVEKFRYDAEINMTAAKHTVFSKAEAKNIRLAFDSACNKLERQFKKQRGKMRESKDSIREGNEEESLPDFEDNE